MTKAARFLFDPRLTTLLGETYRSSEQALKELVDNAWDADARHVWISLPAPMTSVPIVITDDGSGMTEDGVRDEYLKVAGDRRSRKGSQTAVFNRQVKGRKGIGKFAGLMLASSMVLVTRSGGMRTELRVRKDDLLKSSSDLDDIPLHLERQSCPKADHGTTITLEGLNQTLEFPRAERLRELLVIEYGRQPDFIIEVNREVLTIEDLGETTVKTVNIPGLGEVRLVLTVADGRKPLKHPGIAIRVGGKVVGRPGFLGLDQEDGLPNRMLKRLYGEIEADGLDEHVTADWGGINESSKPFGKVLDWARQAVDAEVRTTFKKEIRQVKERQSRQVKERLERLPEHRRRLAEAALDRIFTKFYGVESEERIETIIGVALDAFERDEYWQVIQAIDDARTAGVARLAEALEQFGLVDMAVMAEQARRRLGVLQELENLMNQPQTLEKEMHQVIESNLWIVEPEYTLLASNQTLATVLRQWCDTEFRGERANRRPDLLLCEPVMGRHLLVEFKEPRHPITRDDEMQAIKYRDDLCGKFEQLEVLVIGASRASSIRPGMDASGVRVLSYAALVSKARSRLEWLLNQLKTPHYD